MGFTQVSASFMLYFWKIPTKLPISDQVVIIVHCKKRIQFVWYLHYMAVNVVLDMPSSTDSSSSFWIPHLNPLWRGSEGSCFSKAGSWGVRSAVPSGIASKGSKWNVIVITNGKCDTLFFNCLQIITMNFFSYSMFHLYFEFLLFLLPCRVCSLLFLKLWQYESCEIH
jgi:hypothetical protein